MAWLVMHRPCSGICRGSGIERRGLGKRTEIFHARYARPEPTQTVELIQHALHVQ